MRSRDVLKAGLPVEHLVLVAAWPEAGSIFDEQERAALAWAEVVTRLGDRGVPDSAFEAAAAVFGEKQFADLTIATGLMNTYNRMAISSRATPMALAGGDGKASTHHDQHAPRIRADTLGDENWALRCG